MRAYSEVPQSKVLEGILPIESADMYRVFENNAETRVYYGKMPTAYFVCKPCWSTTALLSILPNEIITDNRFECHYQIKIRKYDGGNNTTLYQLAYGNSRGSSGSWHDMISTGERENLIDACVDMIEKLHELNLL